MIPKYEAIQPLFLLVCFINHKTNNMKKIVLIFGIISGIIVSAGMLFMMNSDSITMENGELYGYSTMIIAFSTIFFGVRAYRDKQSNGTIKFGKAFQIGLFITLIASAFYVTSWMIIYSSSDVALMDEYFEKAIEQVKNSDKTPDQINMEVQSMKDFMELYDNNALVRIGMTFIEIFPVGLLISLICAVILRRKEKALT